MRLNMVVATLAACLIGSATFADTISIIVTPSSAPNAFGSPSYAGYVSNAITGIRNGLATNGAAGPSQYTTITGPIAVANNIVTGFPSWNGVAEPGAPNASELGNRVLFGVDIIGSSATALFSIDRLGFSAFSSDLGNSLGFSFAAGSYTYSNDYVGVLYGADGIRNTSDDIFITSGPANQFVNEIVGRGSGNAWAAYDSDTGATRQEKINNAADGVWSQAGFTPISFQGKYTLGGTIPGITNTVPITGTGTVLFDRAFDPEGAPTPTPLPSAAMAGGVLLGSMGMTRRRKRVA